MTTAIDVLNNAQTKINAGLAEQPKGSNHVPGITDQDGFWDDAWCDMFVSVCMTEAGYPMHFASCYYSIKAYEAGEIGQWVGKSDITNVMPGDQVFYGHNGNDHTGLVAQVDMQGNRILTYEGNWGDKAVALWRNFNDAYVFGFGRPNYDAPVPDPVASTPAPIPETQASSWDGRTLELTKPMTKGLDVAWVQQVLVHQGLLPDNGTGPGTSVDGWYGPATAAAVKQLQADFNAFFSIDPPLDEDGAVGPITGGWLLFVRAYQGY